MIEILDNKNGTADIIVSNDKYVPLTSFSVPSGLTKIEKCKEAYMNFKPSDYIIEKEAEIMSYFDEGEKVITNADLIVELAEEAKLIQDELYAVIYNNFENND